MLSTAASWLALLALAAALTRYYNPQLFKKLTRKTLAEVEQQTETTQKPAVKRQKSKRTHTTRIESNSGASAPTSANEGVANKRRKLVSPPVEKNVATKQVQSKQLEATPKEEIEMSNKAFAQQLAKTQAGTKLEAPTLKGTSKKERRAAKKVVKGDQTGQDFSGPSTETSSTNGGRDVDGDFSPVGSPASGPVSTAPTSRADDVSDMLEAPAAKPTTLRLTDIKEKVKSLPRSVSKAFEPVLSKKQRQRQAKQAEQKALKDESDKLHERKKQEQLRAARTAGGTSNQTKADTFTAKQNAWQSGKPSAVKSQENTADVENAPLLDTFEREDLGAGNNDSNAVASKPLSKITNSVPPTANVNQVRQEKGDNRTSALAASSREKASRPRVESQSSWADEVNDEEQSKWATQLTDEGNWESVTNKKGKKKAKKDNETSSEASSQIARSIPVVNKPVTNGNKTNGIQAKGESVNRFASIQQPTDSSFPDAEWEA